VKQAIDHWLNVAEIARVRFPVRLSQGDVWEPVEKCCTYEEYYETTGSLQAGSTISGGRVARLCHDSGAN
jgi:hypothetical protein